MKTNRENVSQETSSVSTTNFLDKKATQVSFAELVQISQPAVNKHVGRCLQKGQTLRVWLHAYCEQLRNEAAGRGGDDQASLTRSRIKESDAKTAMTVINYHEKIGTLIQAAEGQKVLVEWAGYAVREFENTFSVLVHEIESKHNLQIDEQKIKAITEPAMLRIGKYTEKLGKSLVPESNSIKGM